MVFVGVTPRCVGVVDIFIVELDPEGGIIDSIVPRSNSDTAVKDQRCDLCSNTRAFNINPLNTRWQNVETILLRTYPYYM